MSNIIAYKGNIVHSVALNELQVLTPGLIGVDSSGTIVFLHDLNSSTNSPDYDKLIDVSPRLIIPGFIDGHAHAPQHAFLGVGMHLTLLEWLETYTFPHEARFDSVEYARQVYSKAVRRHLNHGTTTCSYFATIHLESCKVLTDIVLELGQRGYIGKVNMDRNAPNALTEDTYRSLEHTEAFIDYVLSKNTPLVTPVITPRFVPSTSSTLMHGLSQLSRAHTPPLPVQSHLSENQGEIEWVQSLHPSCSSYTDVYASHGLLHERTYMAHCIWCSATERNMIKEHQTGIIHCPNSNFSLSSGVLNVRRLLQEGIKVGLGTDVSGGTHPSMLDAIRQAIVASKLVEMGKGSASNGETLYKSLTYTEAFYLATLGGAAALGLGDTVGNFSCGKAFDALVVNIESVDSPVDVMPEYEGHEKTKQEDVLHRFQQFLFGGDDRNITNIYVQGKMVKG